MQQKYFMPIIQIYFIRINYSSRRKSHLPAQIQLDLFDYEHLQYKSFLSDTQSIFQVRYLNSHFHIDFFHPKTFSFERAKEDGGFLIRIARS